MGEAGAEVVLQHGSVLGHHRWAFLSPAISLWIWATLGLGAQRGKRLLQGPSPEGSLCSGQRQDY